MEICRLDGWSVIVLQGKCRATHLAVLGVAKLVARCVLVSEVYMRGWVSASGIRFFGGGIGDDDTGSGFTLFFEALDDHAIMQRTDFHADSP